MTVGIYCRKSVYSDKSDSIANQERMCRDYASVHFPESAIKVYSDEGYSGANTNRPGLTNLQTDIKSGIISVLIVYQLDRLSRSVRDFSNLYAELEERHITFVSIKESIDTTTPMGRAMMMVTVTFAQMERETIAERIMDNMNGLARRGLWTGGNPPTGYKRTRIMIDGKSHATIVPDPDGVEYVRMVYRDFLAGHTLTGLATMYRQQGITSVRGKYMSSSQIHHILTMPFCVPCAPEVYDHYHAAGCQLPVGRDKWDGRTGMMVYGRTSERSGKHVLTERSEWIVVPGLHEPFVSADDFLAVQARMGQNKIVRQGKYDVPLLKGVVRCKCGRLMQVATKHNAHSVTRSYYCARRMTQGKEACDMRMIVCRELDETVMDVFSRIKADPEVIREYCRDDAEVDTKPLERSLEATQGKINRLVAALEESTGSTASRHIIAEIERLDASCEAIQRELAQARAHNMDTVPVEQRAQELSDLMGRFNQMSAHDRNEVARQVIKRCVWDGYELDLAL